MGGKGGQGWMHIFKLINGGPSELPIIANGNTPWPPHHF